MGLGSQLLRVTAKSITLTFKVRIVITPQGGGGLPYKSDGGARRIFFEVIKGTKILFCGRGPKLILLLGGTKIKHNLSYS